jgi:Ca-activated chloride channel homolog
VGWSYLIRLPFCHRTTSTAFQGLCSLTLKTTEKDYTLKRIGLCVVSPVVLLPHSAFMTVHLVPTLSDPNVPVNAESQRQLSLSLWVTPQTNGGRNAPLNLGLILDHSGSMAGKPLDMVKQAAQNLVDRLHLGDQLSVVVFDHTAKVLIRTQPMADAHTVEAIKGQLGRLQPQGGTAIDKGLQLGLELLGNASPGMISQAFLLTDGENEVGDHQRCLQLAQRAAQENITLSTLGFGYHWDVDTLEQIADAAGGSLSFIEFPEDVSAAFDRLFNRVISVGLTNAYLQIKLTPGVRLAAHKPIAQVTPEVVELAAQPDPPSADPGAIFPNGAAENIFSVRIGDLLIDTPRTLLANLYLPPLPPGVHDIAKIQVQYDDPAQKRRSLQSGWVNVRVKVNATYQPQPHPQVEQHLLALAKYRQTQIAEARLAEGNRHGAATMLGIAAQTALKMGDHAAATVLQQNSTRLQAGEDLSSSDRRKTRIVAKTKLPPNPTVAPPNSQSSVL